MEIAKQPITTSYPVHGYEEAGYGNQQYNTGYEESGEAPKVVKRARPRYYELAVHILAILATTAIILVNVINQYWTDLGARTWGDELQGRIMSQAAQLKYIQFAAKLHEMFMLASISFILLYFFHHRILKRGIPFGFLDAPYIISAGGGLAVLKTRRFLTAWFSSRSNFSLGILLALCTILTAVLQPFSAIALIPSLAWWPVKNPYDGHNFRVYIGNPDQNPLPVKESENSGDVSRNATCLVDTGYSLDVDCPGAGWGEIQQWIRGSIYTSSSTNLTLNEPVTNSQRLLVSRPLSDIPMFGREGYPNRSRTITTTGSAVDTAAIRGFSKYMKHYSKGEISKVLIPGFESTKSSNTSQPLVYSQCSSVVFNSTSPYKITMLDASAPWHRFGNLTYNLEIPNDLPFMSQLPDRLPHFSWLPNQNQSAVSLAVIPVDMIRSDGSVGTQSSLLVTCAFDARWVFSTVRLEPRYSSLVQSNITNLPWFADTDNSLAELQSVWTNAGTYWYSKSEMVTLPSRWLQSLDFNLMYKGTNTTSMKAMLQYFTYTDASRNRTHFDVNDSEYVSFGSQDFTTYVRRVQELVATSISASIADGMARDSYKTFRPYLEIPSPSPSTSGEFMYVDLLASNSSTNKTASEFFANSSREDAPFIEFSAFRYGYSYGFRPDGGGTSIKIALGVLGSYLLTAVVYLVVILVACIRGTYTHSTSYETLRNLLAVAVNSDASDHLKGIGKGEKRSETWKLDAKVKDRGDNRLHLVIGPK